MDDDSRLADPMASYSTPTQGLPSGGYLVMRTIPMPSDANINGDIFGGWIMSRIDQAGSVLPHRISNGRVATVAVKEVLFKEAVLVGDLLSFYAHVVKVGRTSIAVRVEVYAERNSAPLKAVKVTQADLTFVAIDENGRPREIPKQ